MRTCGFRWLVERHPNLCAARGFHVSRCTSGAAPVSSPISGFRHSLRRHHNDNEHSITASHHNPYPCCDRCVYTWAGRASHNSGWDNNNRHSDGPFGYTCPDCNTPTNSDTRTNINPHTCASVYAHAYADINPYACTYTYTNAHACTDADADACTNGYANARSDADSYSHAETGLP